MLISAAGESQHPATQPRKAHGKAERKNETQERRTRQHRPSSSGQPAAGTHGAGTCEKVRERGPTCTSKWQSGARTREAKDVRSRLLGVPRALLCSKYCIPAATPGAHTFRRSTRRQVRNRLHGGRNGEPGAAEGKSDQTYDIRAGPLPPHLMGCFRWSLGRWTGQGGVRGH